MEYGSIGPYDVELKMYLQNILTDGKRIFFFNFVLHVVGLDSVDSVATRYGVDGPGSSPGGGEVFRTRPDWPWGPPSLLYKRYGVIPGGIVAGA